MFYVGMDVAKATVACCLLSPGTEQGQLRSFSNNRTGMKALLKWLHERAVPLDQVQVVMEATGVYHQAAAMHLHEAGVQVAIVNPAQVKDFGKGLAVRTKTDGMDSWVLARFGQVIQPAPWQPPRVEVRELQALLARQRALAEDLQRERNRLEKADATLTPTLVQQSLQDGIAFLTQQLKRLQRDIDDHIDRHPRLREDRALLESIPAIGAQTGKHMLSIFHAHHFERAEQSAAYLGLVPVERQSGTSVHGRPRLSKAGPAHMRAILYMAAVVATRHNPHVKALYERLLAKGKTKMAALGAAMRKLVHLCFGVLKSRRPYSPNHAANP
jgi:transposase